MSLYWSAPAGAPAGPKMHALVIGVGDYAHLGLDAKQPSPILSGLDPLTTTPPAAIAVARWLETKFENPACQRGSIELLLSPAQTLTRADGTQVAIAEASMANIRTAVNDWFKRCNTDTGNIAFFYFAGHGVSSARQFILPSDFGAPGADVWLNCIDFTGFQTGMLRCAAQTQLYFVDACQDKPHEILIDLDPTGQKLVTGATAHNNVNLSAAHFAAAANRKTYGLDGRPTFFCEALLLCLDGAAARRNAGKWRVDCASLSSGLASVVGAIAQREKVALYPDCKVQKEVPFHYPKSASVMLAVSCASQAAASDATITIKQGGKVLNSPPSESRPWVREVSPGTTDITVTFTHSPAYTETEDLVPPTYSVEVPQ